MYFCILCTLFCTSFARAQLKTLQIRLVDEVTEQPIPDAHIFINNSSLGTTSDLNGLFVLEVSTQETQELIITHVSYETLILKPIAYLPLKNQEILKLTAKAVDLNEVLITAKKNSDWKKNLRKFKKTLLGKGKAASNCEIINPEVLQFEEKNGTFKATAYDLLIIENNFLEYTIRFSLESLTIDEDGSSSYKGYAQYIDNSEENDARIVKRRDKMYSESIPHFLLSLLKSSNATLLQDLGYQLTFEGYNAGEFKVIREPLDPSGLVHVDSTTGWYQLYFSEYLTVKHKGIRVSSSDKVQIPVSSAEQQKFGAGSSQSLSSNQQNAISRLYKTDEYLTFDQRGNIVNKSAVKQFGYWADQRLATTLPIDYKEIIATPVESSGPKVIDTLTVFKDLLGKDNRKKEDAALFLQNNWSNDFVPPLLDIILLSQNEWQQKTITSLLNDHVPNIKADYYDGIQWLWQNEPYYGDYYANFKGYLYSAVDPKFYNYFNDRSNQAKIRLDEIVWGGVKQDGIPPLRSPDFTTANAATYLSESDVIFGLVVNGEARAFPQRILAWHEFLTDTVGEQSIAVVYCTLCGTVIVYDTEHNGIKHELGTSGFLYRSNKLMYDEATQSLWSTILGEPVVGPLVDQDIALDILPVETTDWGTWRKRYPNTKVLSLNTGHQRDYSEGEAYKDYYATDNLMFPVLNLDNRLANKTRVFVPRPLNFENQPLAVSVDYLMRKRLYHDQIGSQKLVILTEENGASRAFAIDEQQFKSYKNGKLLDKNNQEWKIKEEALISPEGQRLSRLPAHEVFWFAWVNVYPNTRIIF